MLRFVCRLLGLACLAGAFAACVIDGAGSIAANQLTLAPIGATLYWLLPTRLASLQAFVQQINPLLWDPVLLGVLKLPTWGVLAAIGLALFYLVRRRPRRIGYSNRER